jgi:hypothetical protein
MSEFYVGQRVVHTASGNLATVTSVTGTSMGVRYDNGGTSHGPLSHGGYRPAAYAIRHTFPNGGRLEAT